MTLKVGQLRTERPPPGLRHFGSRLNRLRNIIGRETTVLLICDSPLVAAGSLLVNLFAHSNDVSLIFESV